MITMRNILLAASALLFAAPAMAQAETGWQAVEERDALTDKVSREVCTRDADFSLCFSFNQDGVWATVVSLSNALFDSELYPAFRIDQHKAIESVTPGVLSLKRTLRTKMFPRQWEPSHISWRAQVPSRSGAWTSQPPMLIEQMRKGERMLMRVYLTGGYQRDVIFPLNGFCAAAAKVYPPTAPRLTCD